MSDDDGARFRVGEHVEVFTASSIYTDKKWRTARIVAHEYRDMGSGKRFHVYKIDADSMKKPPAGRHHEVLETSVRKKT